MKFSIRDLFLVTVIVALALGWSLNFWELRRQRGENEYLLEAIRNSGYAPSGDFFGPNLSALPRSSALGPNPPKD